MQAIKNTVPFLVLALLSLTGCASVPRPVPGGPDARAIQILQQAADAQGSASLDAMNDVNVRFEGEWNWLVARVQPVLVDNRFRGKSEERYLIHQTETGQAHIGAGGTKQVYRDQLTTRVWYNGAENHDADVRDAAALVADNYRMFLLGPWFFKERSAPLQYVGVETVDGRSCDNLLATLKPGIGNSREDRVVISIDRDLHLIRRLRITLDGLGSTRGAVADIYLRDYVRIGGVLWPTNFYEELKRPFDSSVHRWRLVAIDLDRQLDTASLNRPGFGGPAAAPAGAAKTSMQTTQLLRAP